MGPCYTHWWVGRIKGRIPLDTPTDIAYYSPGGLEMSLKEFLYRALLVCYGLALIYCGLVTLKVL